MTGNLLLADAKISRVEEWAVLAGGLVLDGGAFARWLTTRGRFRLPGARLLSGPCVHGARLENTGGVALAAGGVTASTVDCSLGFTAQGSVRLRRARIEGLLALEGARLNGDGAALDCVAMHVGDFDYRTAAPLSGLVDLRSAQATWCQESERSWPEKVLLEGVTYGSIRFRDTPSAAGEGETPDRDEVARRLAWARSESRVCPAAIRATRGLVPADRPRRRPPRAPCQTAPPTPHPVPAGTGVGAPARRERRLWLPALVGRRQAPDTAPAGHPGFR